MKQIYCFSIWFQYHTVIVLYLITLFTCNLIHSFICYKNIPDDNKSFKSLLWSISSRVCHLLSLYPAWSYVHWLFSTSPVIHFSFSTYLQHATLLTIWWSNATYERWCIQTLWEVKHSLHCFAYSFCFASVCWKWHLSHLQSRFNFIILHDSAWSTGSLSNWGISSHFGRIAQFCSENFTSKRLAKLSQ